MYYEPQTLQAARGRVQQGIVPSDRVKLANTTARAKSVGLLRSHVYANPVLLASARYVQDHSQRDYDRLLRRLFDELFPREQTKE